MIYNVEMKTDKKRGRPSGYPPELGLGVKKNPRYPLPIHMLLQEQAVKNLLSRMALDEEFKSKILVQVEEE